MGRMHTPVLNRPHFGPPATGSERRSPAASSATVRLQRLGPRTARIWASAALLAASVGCGSSTPASPGGDGGVGGCTNPADGGLCPFVSPGASAPKGQILVTASGEALALGGYAFPAPAPDSPVFVDGWSVKFTHVLVTLDHVRLHENPDTAPTDQRQMGALVAEVDGPWAIDLHKGGPLQGAGGSGEEAVPLAVIPNLNLKSGAPAFDPTVRYAFGFDTVPATESAYDVDLDAEGRALYQQMISKGYTVLYAGTASFVGGPSCSSPTTSYDFSQLPMVVDFQLGFASPTTYENCQNPDLTGGAFPGEEAQRGIQINQGTWTRAQLTVHTDHPFWETIVHDGPMHFDMLAARKVGVAHASVTLDDVVGVDPTYITDSNGVGVPWRSCVSTYTAQAGVLSFDAVNLPVNPSAAPSQALRDLYDFIVYNQSTQGHLNSDGLCAVERRYPSPP